MEKRYYFSTYEKALQSEAWYKEQYKDPHYMANIYMQDGRDSWKITPENKNDINHGWYVVVDVASLD
jgi:hypothetical protein